IAILQSVSGLGVDLHLGRTAGPWFLDGAVGRSRLAQGYGNGFAALAGAGRDLGRVAQLRLTLSYSHPTYPGFHQDLFVRPLLLAVAHREGARAAPAPAAGRASARPPHCPRDPVLLLVAPRRPDCAASKPPR